MGIHVDIDVHFRGAVTEVALDRFTMTRINRKAGEQIAGRSPVLKEVHTARPGRPQAVDEVDALQTADQDSQSRP